MKFASFEHFGLSPWRFASASVAVASAVGAVAWAVFGNALGAAKGPAVVVIAALTFYVAVTIPRRVVDSQRVAQARDSVVLSAASDACLSVTGSRSRTLILLRSREPTVSRALTEAGRLVLLGERPELSVEEATKGISSYSAAAALKGVASMTFGSYDPGDEENRGLAVSSELSRETKLPAFMTVCFFSPIMLVLYSVFAHAYGPLSMMELAAFEFFVLDLAFYLCSGGRGHR